MFCDYNNIYTVELNMAIKLSKPVFSLTLTSLIIPLLTAKMYYNITMMSCLNTVHIRWVAGHREELESWRYYQTRSKNPLCGNKNHVISAVQQLRTELTNRPRKSNIKNGGRHSWQQKVQKPNQGPSLCLNENT